MTQAIKSYAEQAADILSRMEDLTVEFKALMDAAKEEGINVKALRKLAKELNTSSDKLDKQYADEEQLEMFRVQVGIRRRKGLDVLEAAE